MSQQRPRRSLQFTSTSIARSTAPAKPKLFASGIRKALLIAGFAAAAVALTGTVAMVAGPAAAAVATPLMRVAEAVTVGQVLNTATSVGREMLAEGVVSAGAKYAVKNIGNGIKALTGSGKEKAVELAADAARPQAQAAAGVLLQAKA